MQCTLANWSQVRVPARTRIFALFWNHLLPRFSAFVKFIRTENSKDQEIGWGVIVRCLSSLPSTSRLEQSENCETPLRPNFRAKFQNAMSAPIYTEADISGRAHSPILPTPISRGLSVPFRTRQTVFSHFSLGVVKSPMWPVMSQSWRPGLGSGSGTAKPTRFLRPAYLKTISEI